MKKNVLNFALAIVLLQSLSSFAQPCIFPPLVPPIGVVTLNAGPCGSQIICNNSPLCVGITYTGSVDSTAAIIDGTCMGWSGAPPSSFTHQYSRLQNCLPDGIVKDTVQIGVFQRSGNTINLVNSLFFIVSIQLSPIASFQISDTICINDGLILQSQPCPNSVNPYYHWDFGDGTTSNLANPFPHHYSIPGIYTVSLALGNNCDTLYSNEQVQVVPAATVSPSLNLTTSCAPLTTLAVANAQNATSVHWSSSNPGAVTFSNANSGNTTISISQPGTYTITLIANGFGNSCNVTWSQTVILVPGPTIITNSILNSCSLPLTITPSSVFDVNGGSPGQGYHWTIIDLSNGSVVYSDTNAIPPSYTINTYGDFVIKLDLHDMCGDYFPSDTFHIQEPTTINPILNISSTCSGSTFNSVVNSLHAQGFHWSVNPVVGIAISNPSDSTPTFTVIQAGTYTISLIADGVSPACGATWSTQVNFSAAPTITLSHFGNSCNIPTLVDLNNIFNVSGGSASLTYTYEVRDSASNVVLFTNGTSSPGIYTITTSGTYIINLNLIDSCGSRQETDTIRIAQAPTISSTITQNQPCAPASFTCIAQGTDIYQYTWSTNSTAGVVIQSLYDSTTVITMNTAGPNTITVTGQGVAPGCVVTSSLNINVASSPVINSISISNYCQATVNFNPNSFASVSGSTLATIYSWKLIDQSTGIILLHDTTNNPPTLQLDTGDYRFEVLITDVCGVVPHIDTFKVVAPPVAQISTDLTSGCSPLNVSFTSIGMNDQSATFSWDFGNGMTGVGLSSNAVFNAMNSDSMNFTATLTVSIPSCTTVTASVLITAYSAPLVTFSPSYYSACPTTVIDFYNSTTGYYDSLGWYINGQFITNNFTLPSRTFNAINADSTYEVKLVVYHKCGIDTLVKTIHISPEIFVPIANADRTNYCQGEVVNVSSNTNTTFSFFYNFGDGNTGLGPNQYSHQYDSAGTYTIIVSVNSGCSVRDETVVVIIHPKPELQISIRQASLCTGQEVSITNSSIGGAIYIWNFGDSVVDTTNIDPTHLYSLPGHYILELLGVTINGCRDSIQRPLDIRMTPDVALEVDSLELCLKEAVINFNEMLVDENPNYQYLWTVDSDTVANPIQYVIENKGEYSFQVTANNGGCKASQTGYIKVNPSPTARFEIDQSRVRDFKLEYFFRNNSISFNNLSCSWNFDDGNTSDEISPSHVYDHPGNYTIKLIVTNSFGCSSSTEHPIDTKDDFAFYVPENFSPNGDGINDMFSGVGYGVKSIKLLIYDRWGLKIFESSNIDGWDGKTNGRECQQDVYVYKYEVLDFSEGKHNYIGHVSIIY